MEICLQQAYTNASSVASGEHMSCCGGSAELGSAMPAAGPLMLPSGSLMPAAGCGRKCFSGGVC